MSPIQRAVGLFASQAQFAEAISDESREVKQAQVSHWFTGRKPVPARHCIPIEQATKGRVTRYDLRPDVFGEPNQAA